MGTIIVSADKVWELFQQEKTKLRTTLKEIANNPEFGVVVYLTSDGENGKENPDIIVYKENDEFYEETCFGKEDCEDAIRRIYEQYLSDKIASLIEEDEQPEDMDDEEYTDMEIEWRETEIDNALYDFLDIVLEGDIDDSARAVKQEFFIDVKEHILEYLARKWEFDIRRPMYLEDESGEEFYSEYPYSLLEFDDEDDPIYFNA